MSKTEAPSARRFPGREYGLPGPAASHGMDKCPPARIMTPAAGGFAGGGAMTDLTQRQLHDLIVRSLKATGKRMTAKYRGATDRPKAPARARKRGKAAGSKSVRKHG